ncbi:T9SS type A sorting domain-containing protein [Olleya sp. YSTF-M6]|uniref:T9SS type A sorting domain-containing protein n=1 Tax=Olleya sediminilitoris TaxID=2795739 RepID=A0ABS1WMR5_9FLAO|nr:T9SS type A sorting domain-containing protein [Olleya sediminilitoris]MBL7560348.1 T9SS type A sorting domain-containing protein [Olleya sediminilitoris]
MKKTTYLLSFLLLTIFSISNSYSQCSFDSNDGGTVTDANFTTLTSAFSPTIGIGNSWTACGNGTLDKISVLAITDGQTATIGVYSGAGNGGTLLGSATATTTAATSTTERNLVFDFSALNISLTNNSTYTWAIISGTFATRLTNSSIYPAGSAYSNTTEFTTNDFMFKVDITSSTLGVDNFTISETTVKLFPNPCIDYIQISGLIKSEVYTIYNNLGAEVYNGSAIDNEKINIEDLTSGLYFLKLKNGRSIKFIKE